MPDSRTWYMVFPRWGRSPVQISRHNRTGIISCRDTKEQVYDQISARPPAESNVRATAT